MHGLAGAHLDTAAARPDGDPPLGDRHPRARAAPGPACGIADGLLDDELGAAHADGRRRRDQPVVLVPALADRAGQRAQRPARQQVDRLLHAAVEAVGLDRESRSGLQRHDRAVGEAQLHAAVDAGLDPVARVDRVAADRAARRLAARPGAHHDHVARHQPQPGVLGERGDGRTGRGRERRDPQRRRRPPAQAGEAAESAHAQNL
ncbi:MAG TPA: hypothetical protein PKC20_18435 [Burkholderiaceae bacterium]|nr:hypothetical protein [Burkholderiaceae bacterium]